jgi:hypothetical protein
MVSGLDGGLSDLGFRLVLGNSQAAFVGNMSGLPGPMQLLPSQSFPRDDQQHSWNDSLDNGTAFADLYDNAACPPGIDDPNLALPPDAKADLGERLLDLAAYLTNPVPPEPPPAPWLIYGTGVKTEVRITAAAGPAEPGLSLHGDGTVPSLSAVTFPAVPADQQFAVDGLDHAKACLHPQVIAHTAEILQ